MAHGEPEQLGARLDEESARTLPPAEELASRFPRTGEVTPLSEQQWQQCMSDLKFGSQFSEHMAAATWTPQAGWHDLQIKPYGPLSVSPAASVLHYGQEIFEGMKAYRHADGSVWTFRPGYNAARFNDSADRMAMPRMDPEDFVASLVALVRADQRWVPTEPGTALYLRPFMFASEGFLGVRSAHEFTYLVIASPVGPYFTNGFAPVSIWVTRKYHRAGPGGTGAAKTGGNYASSLLPQAEASERGFEQVCFLDAATAQNLEELGGMNVFVVGRDGRIRTPKLTGTILAGGTRSAILTLLREDGYDVSEETIPLEELVADIQSGKVQEMFACGTAAVVAPIGRLGSEEFDLHLPSTTVTTKIYERLTAIQNGTAEDTHGWMYRIL
ncbi:MAG: branched-chain amino acid aminotransferase [Actinomycetaceae bacterium]|nr:branched-chain amino acid aminotransferase [Actinomycetaceae bacterium]